MFGHEYSLSFNTGWDFIVQNYIFGSLIYFTFCLVTALPIILAVYIGYKLILRRKEFAKYCMPLLILIGATFIPVLMYIENRVRHESGPDWGAFFVFIMVASNVFVLIGNEVAYFMNIKQLK